MTATAWAHLPNKIHIDQVLVDLTNHIALFMPAYQQAHLQARNQAWDHAYSQARDQAYYVATNALLALVAYEQAWDQVFYVARDALLILIAYDDASKYLTIPADQAIVYGELVSDNQYILLKQYLQVKQKIAELITA
jgi:hypothetical protein